MHAAAHGTAPDFVPLHSAPYAGDGHDLCHVKGPRRDLYLDITRLRQDTGHQPAYHTGRAVADYLDWLRAGNER